MFFLKIKIEIIGIEKVKKIIAVLENNEKHKKKPEKNIKKLFKLFFALRVKKKIEINKNNKISITILNLVRFSINGGDEIKTHVNKHEFLLFFITKFNNIKVNTAIKKA